MNKSDIELARTIFSDLDDVNDDDLMAALGICLELTTSDQCQPGIHPEQSEVIFQIEPLDAE